MIPLNVIKISVEILGVAQLGEEGVIWLSSAYEGTVESKITTKKPL